jgi:hypothetical protein
METVVHAMLNNPVRFLWLIVVMALAGCAIKPNIDFKQGFDFAALKTFTVIRPVADSSEDLRTSGPLMHERIHRAIENVLIARGYTSVPDQADMQVTFRISKKTGVESRGSGVSVGYGVFSGGSAVGIGYGFPGYDVSSYEEGILTIDMLKGGDDSPFWRGSAGRRLYNGSTPESSEQLVNEIVGEILDEFPPGRVKP